jgi:glutamate:GABA antiporter
MLGTSAVLVTVGPTDIDLVSPISQSLMAGTRPGDLGRSLIPLLLLAVLGIRVAQCSISFAGSARLPLVTGWDHLLPAWFTRLHPRWRTPVNSALFVGLMTMGSGLAAIAGAGRQEAFQLAVNASGVMYASVYMVMFALPVIGFRGAGARAPLWLRAASVSGFLMAALFVVFSVMPIIDVPSPLRFAGKIAGTFLLSNALGLWVYFGYRRRANRAMADAPVTAAG